MAASTFGLRVADGSDDAPVGLAKRQHTPELNTHSRALYLQHRTCPMRMTATKHKLWSIASHYRIDFVHKKGYCHCKAEAGGATQAGVESGILARSLTTWFGAFRPDGWSNFIAATN
jgi:hypothetical protein